MILRFTIVSCAIVLSATAVAHAFDLAPGAALPSRHAMSGKRMAVPSTVTRSAGSHSRTSVSGQRGSSRKGWYSLNDRRLDRRQAGNLDRRQAGNRVLGRGLPQTRVSQRRSSQRRLTGAELRARRNVDLLRFSFLANDRRSRGIDRRGSRVAQRLTKQVNPFNMVDAYVDVHVGQEN